MLSLKDFKSVQISPLGLNDVLGGACTGGGATLVRVETIGVGPYGESTYKRNHYKTWSSDEEFEGGTIYFDEGTETGNWYHP